MHRIFGMANPDALTEIAEKLKAMHPDFPLDRFNDKTLMSLWMTTMQGGASAWTVPTANGNREDSEHCVIVTPPEKWEAKDYYSALAGINPKNVTTEMAGTKDAWMAMVMMHEANHCANPNNEKSWEEYKDAYETINAELKKQADEIKKKRDSDIEKVLKEGLDEKERLKRISKIRHEADAAIDKKKQEANEKILPYVNAFNLSRSQEEANADQFAAHIIEDLIKDGHTEFKGLIDAVSLARSLGTFQRQFESHSSGGTLIVDRAPDELKYSPGHIKRSVTKTQKILFNYLGKRNENIKELAKGMQSILAYEAKKEMNSKRKSDLNRGIKSLTNVIQSGDEKAIEKAIKAQRNDRAVWKLYKEGLKKYHFAKGLQIAKKDHKQFYDTALRMYRHGKFDDDKLGKKYVERAIIALQKYSPDLIKKKKKAPKPSVA